MSKFTNALLAVALLFGAAFVGMQVADMTGPDIIDEAPVIDESTVGTSYTRFTDLDFTRSFAFGTFGNETEIIDADGNWEVGDDLDFGFGADSPAILEWTTADTDANCLLFDLPTGGAVDVPVIIVASADSDFGYFGGSSIVEPTFAVENLVGTSFIALDFSATTLSRLHAGGLATALTVATDVAGADIILDAADAAANTAQQYVSITGSTPAHASGTPTDIFLDITPTIGINTATATVHLVDLSFTSPAWATGEQVNTIRGIYLDPTIGNASAGTNVIALIDVPAITDSDADVDIYGFRVGDITQAGGGQTVHAIDIGANWDLGINSASAVDIQGTTNLDVVDIDDAVAIEGNLIQDGTLVALDGQTSVRGISAAFTSLEAPAIRFGLNVTDYMQFAVTQTSSNVAITHTGSAGVTWTADTFDFIGITNLDNTDIDGTLDAEGTTVLLNGSTSVRGVSAGFTSLESSDIRFGYNVTDYMKFAVTQTSSNVAITHTGTAAVTWTADSFDFAGTMALDATTLSDVLTFSGGGTIDNTDTNTLTLVETNITTDAATAAIVDGATTADLISAGHADIEAPDIRFGLNATDYVKLAVTQTSSNVAITHSGSAAVTWTADSFDFIGSMNLDNTDIDGTFTLDGTTAALTCSTSIFNYTPLFRIGFDATDYMLITTTQTSSNVAITHPGNTPAITWTATSFDFVGTMALDTTTFGADSAGADATFYGDTTLYNVRWDASGDTNGTWYFGADDYGFDVVWYGRTQTESVTWDASADTWYFGADDEGVDVTAYGETAGAALDWDASDDALELDGTANITHKDATNAGAMFISAYNLVYTQTDSAVTVFTLPAYSYVTEVKVMTTTAFDESGTLTCDIGWSGTLEGYASDLDIKAADGWAYADVYTYFGVTTGGTARDILVSIADQNGNGTAGAATVYIEWTMKAPGSG